MFQSLSAGQGQLVPWPGLGGVAAVPATTEDSTIPTADPDQPASHSLCPI